MKIVPVEQMFEKYLRRRRSNALKRARLAQITSRWLVAELHAIPGASLYRCRFFREACG